MRPDGRGRRAAVVLEVLALAAASLIWTGGCPGAGAAAGDRGVRSAAADLAGRTLLGLASDDFSTQLYAKVDKNEHCKVRNHKIQVRWEEVEPAKGAYKWERLDAVIDACLANGSESIMLLLHGQVPGWARDPQWGQYSSKAPPKDMADWRDFCAAVAGRYGPVVGFYEIWNEPSLDVDSPSAAYWDVRFFGAQVETDYLPMLQSAHDAIKGADPDALVVTGSLVSGISSSPDEGFDLYRLLFDDVNRPGQDVSMRVRSDRGIIAERPMYFNYRGEWTGGHDVVGATSPHPLWYFAEGCTGEGFEEWLCLQNPNEEAVTAEVTYIFADGAAPLVRRYPVGANRRFTVKVNDEVGPGRDVSIKVEARPAGGAGTAPPIVAERPMYFNYRGEWTGGHDVLGANQPRDRWLFAEGYTGEGFEEWLCLMNPNGEAVTAEVTYIFADGAAPLVRRYPVGANRRFTVKVNDEVGPGRDVSIKVEARPAGGAGTAPPIVAERPMYFNYGRGWTGGHCVVGCPDPGPAYYFAEGYTGEGFEEWLCLMNPNGEAVTAEVTYIFADGAAPLVRRYPVGANRRFTVKVNDEVGPGRDVSIKVEARPAGGAEAAPPIVAERPMYFDFRGRITGGHDVIGAGAPSQDWYFAEGCAGYGIEEWLCLMNPGEVDAEATITFMMKAGHTLERKVELKARSRRTLNVNAILGFSASCDEVAIHPYREPRHWGYFYHNVVQALESVGCTRELVATEIGWPNYSCNPNYPVEDKKQEQAAALGDEGLGTLWDYGCRKIWIYKDVDEDPGTSWDYNYYGLFDYTGRPHPAWLEYKYWQSTLPDYPDLPSSRP